MRSQYDTVLADTLAMVNTIRGAFGEEALSELPSATPGDSTDCVYARAFRSIGAQQVSGHGSVQFDNIDVAEKVAALVGTTAHGASVTMPYQFAAVISEFDGGRLPELGVR